MHDIANAYADASGSVIVGDVTTEDAFGHNITVDATGADVPVLLAIAGSFSDTGVDIFAPGRNAQSGITDGNGLSGDVSGGGGGDATGGRSGNIDRTQGLVAAIDTLIAAIEIISADG